MMDADPLFVATMADLRARTDLLASDYDLTQAAGLIRRLLLDEHPLLTKVNRRHQMKPTYIWGRLFVATPAEGGLTWVPLLWLDPILYDLQRETLPLAPGQEPLATPSPKTGTLKQFLAETVLERDSATASVKEVIRYYAHQQGGVHHDPAPADNPLINDLRALSPRALDQTMLGIARVVYRALEPLATRAHLIDQKHPFGLDRMPVVVVQEGETAPAPSDSSKRLYHWAEAPSKENTGP